MNPLIAPDYHTMLRLQFLDHVALRVRDIHRSAEWYEKVLGLQRIHPEEWGPFPIFMVAGQTGIALFPTRSEKAQLPPEGDWVRAHHYAFRVDPKNFEKAKAHLTEQEVEWTFQDHHHFHSIYFNDPDGHHLELTVQVRGL